MANPAHEALLRQGLGEWNQWRTLNPSVIPDLAGASLAAARLEGADLSHALLEGAKLIRTRLAGADLRYADLRNAQMQEVDLTDADLFRANLESAALAGAKLRRTRLFGANLRGAQLPLVDFRKADLREADLEGADLRESRGTGASFERARFEGAELSGCHLEECNLTATEGLVADQLESAILGETTRFTGEIGAESAASLSSLRSALEALRARATGEAVAESELTSYRRLLQELGAHGIDAPEARVEERELVRPVTSWERTPGGEAFEIAPVRWLPADEFRRKVDRLLSEIGRRVD